MRADNKNTHKVRANPVDPRAMQDSANNPTPGEPPLTVADEEVERLLQQAESLTKEIVDDVGETPTADAAQQNTAGQFGTVEPDPEAAVELVAQDVAQLTESFAAEPSTEAVGNGDAKVEAVATDQDVEAEDESSATLTDDIQPAAAVESASQSPTDEHTTAKETFIASAETPDSTTPDAADTAAPPAPLESSLPRSMTAAARHVALYSARSLIFAVPNAFIRLIMLFDLPFRGISPGVKSVLGVIGLISLLMGGVAKLAPSMMQSNPYALMPPQPHVEEPPAAEHGGNAKSEHKEESKPAHEEKKPEGGGNH